MATNSCANSNENSALLDKRTFSYLAARIKPISLCIKLRCVEPCPIDRAPAQIVGATGRPVASEGASAGTFDSTKSRHESCLLANAKPVAAVLVNK